MRKGRRERTGNREENGSVNRRKAPPMSFSSINPSSFPTEATILEEQEEGEEEVGRKYGERGTSKERL
jgi:hypothetical protein